MLDLKGAPDAIVQLASWLADMGMRPVQEHMQDHYNQHVVFENADTRVVVNATRGDWTVGMGPASFHDTFDAGTWRTYLDQAAIDEDTSLQGQVDFLRQRWPEALRAASADSECEAKLREFDREFVRGFLGWDPPVP